MEDNVTEEGSGMSKKTMFLYALAYPKTSPFFLSGLIIQVCLEPTYCH